MCWMPPSEEFSEYLYIKGFSMWRGGMISGFFLGRNSVRKINSNVPLTCEKMKRVSVNHPWPALNVT